MKKQKTPLDILREQVYANKKNIEEIVERINSLETHIHSLDIKNQWASIQTINDRVRALEGGRVACE